MLYLIFIVLLGLGAQAVINNSRAEKRHKETKSLLDALVTSSLSQQTYSRLIMQNATSLSKALECVLENQKAIMVTTEQIMGRQNK